MTHAVQVPRNPQQSAGYRTWLLLTQKPRTEKFSSA